MTEGIITKFCPKCSRNLPASEFSKDKRSRDGLQSKCKACSKAYYEANKVRILKQQQVRYEANKAEILDKHKAYREPRREEIARKVMEHYAANRDEILEARRERYRCDPERVLAQNRQWSKDNPDKRREMHRNRRAQERGATGSATSQDVQNRFSAHGHKCIYCAAQSDDLHMDHIKPLSKGGSNWPGNLAPACGPCNLSKGAKWGQELIDWGLQRFGAERVKSWPFPKK
jgi:5-methylcytosine-specific restriction endonuclease McrA